MLVLLPPSESKWAGPARGAPVRLASLSHPELTGARERVLDALVALSAREDAPALLGAGAGLAAVVRANTTLRTRPAAPASRVYTGVLFDALDLPSVPAAAARRVLVVSALWGVLRPGDRVPGYRLSMGTDLPGTGPLAAFWRPHLGAALAPSGVVVDCRSAAYAAAWAPDAATAARTVRVRVLRAGRVVSHAAKHTRGLLARHLLTRAGRAPRTPAELLDATAGAFGAQLLEPERAGTPWTLEVEAA
ncbi:YaaA family protein [Kineococcus gypseus]|uniref:YaaA family protein n=1 Tax=Kineococcus gypseus TaxID=1637102 RepID=UPI003D7CA418